MLLDLNTAEHYYQQAIEIFEDKNINNRQKAVNLYQILTVILAIIVENEKIIFTEFARLHYIINKFNLPEYLKIKIFAFRNLNTNIRKKYQYNPTNKELSYYFQTYCELIAWAGNLEIPQNIKFLFIDEKEFIPAQTLAKVEKNIVPELRCVLSRKNDINNLNILTCIDEGNNEIEIELLAKNADMVNMLWKTATILLTHVEFVQSKERENTNNIIDLDRENESNYEKKIILLYKATSKTNIVIEPDFLIDVTEVVECFTSKNEFPLIPILNKFLPQNPTSAAFKGNIINSFFDELIGNPDIDFNSAIENAISRKPLQLLAYMNELNKNGINFENYSHFLNFFRGEFYDSFNKLRSIVADHFLNTVNYIEPSFISTTYGMQGRLDLMTLDENNVDIVELKSGKAPNKNIAVKIGMTEKHELILPLWINHYIQIACYNLLLQNAFPDRTGVSSILYSNPNEKFPVRSVVDNSFVQTEILILRNWLIAFMRELSIGNLNIFNGITKEQLHFFPPFIQSEAINFIEKFANLNSCEKEYFKTQIAFITKEIFSDKTGLFSNGQNAGFAGLWLYSIEEKKQKSIIISNLKLNQSESDFTKMHIAFDCLAETNVTQFRKGDICIIYPQKYENSVTHEQILRGRILHIDEKKLIISLRNKLSQNVLNEKFEWILESDYIEMMNKYYYSSVAELIFSGLPNKNYILGISEPEFIINEKANSYIDNISDIKNEKKNILKKTISAKHYFLIQGPRGTGKTKYILRYLVQTLFDVLNENILIITYTNRAADEICSALQLISTNFQFIRLGNHDSSEYKPNLISNISIAELGKKIEQTKIFVSTVSSALTNPELFQIKKFDTILVDEATQILEKDIVGLLLKSHKFIMIGDEKQLPAVTSLAPIELNVENEILNKIELKNLKDSLFERLLRVCKKNNWQAFAMLEEQSRMSPSIMRLANKMFYEDKLKINLEGQISEDLLKNIHNSDNNTFALQTLISRNNCIFINSQIEAHNKVNFNEIDIIMELIRYIEDNYGNNFNEKTLGIISPWRMQCNEIWRRLSPVQKQLITVDTVERFQGSERNIIIFSTATNNHFLLKLLSEIKIIDNIAVDRKLNVAITRAKQKFIMLGNLNLLSQNPIYNKLITLLNY